MIYRKEVLEAVGGVSEEIEYGEDRDLNERIIRAGYEKVNIPGAKHYSKVPDSIRDTYYQGRWYGKTFLRYFKRYPGEWMGLAQFLYFASIPFTLALSIFLEPVRYLMALQALMMVYLILEYVRLTGSPYSVFIPVIKQVRSIGIFIGIFEGLFTDDRGKSK